RTPQVCLANERGQVVEVHYLAEGAVVEVREGQQVSPGTLLARLPHEWPRMDFDTGPERLADLLEARPPRSPTTLAELDGIVRLEQTPRRGQRVVHVRLVDEEGRPLATEVEHFLAAGKSPYVRDGERVKAGQPLTWGEKAPRDVLRICGTDAAQAHLL